MKEFITVSALNEYIGALLEADPILQGIWVKGEISGFRLFQQSGHMYFTLKDGDAAVSCVMFRSRNQGLKFLPEDGMEVLLFGAVGIFSKQGRYQLYVENMQPFGAGALYLQLEKLKKELDQQGYFAMERKKPLPAMPHCVGVVTSQDGAALRDILKVIRQRCPSVRVVVAHSSVQGVDAPRELAAGIGSLNAYGQVDVIIVGRGGGSLEDLMAFNSREVVEAISLSVIPVISAVGHEVDVTLADLAADVRAATPTQAAQMAVPDQTVLRDQLHSINRQLTRAMQKNLRRQAEALDYLMMRRIWRDPGEFLEKRHRDLRQASQALIKAMQKNLQTRQHGLAMAVAGLDQLSPLKVMGRGYAILSHQQTIIKSIEQVSPGMQLKARLSDGQLVVEVKEKEKIAHEKTEF
ncbi:MAG TPA: exodeoxyribonuclease VII large subunit [Syntrophomonas sp.]|nr:exodeoxyribonuclease VII large subunit [Syntrophomonas sp.]HRW12382.1 exodeoxyribonuclease VII large subunit [Syntrophomonas sp.]